MIGRGSGQAERDLRDSPNLRNVVNTVTSYVGTALNRKQMQTAGKKRILFKIQYQKNEKLLACEVKVNVFLSYLSHMPERAEDRQPSVSYVPSVAIRHQRCFRRALRQLLPFCNIWLGRRLLFFLRPIPAF